MIKKQILAKFMRKVWFNEIIIHDRVWLLTFTQIHHICRYGSIAFLFSLCGVQLKYRCGYYPHCTITKVSHVVMHFHVNKLVNVSMLTINVDNCIHLVFKITAS